MNDLIKRRKAIKKTALILGAGTLAPSLVCGILNGCQAEKGPGWTPRALSNSDLSMVKAWIDIVIPETETPGASQLLVHRFIDTMIEEFLDGDDIATIRAGLGHLRSLEFDKKNSKQKIGLVIEMSTNDTWQPFFILMKSMTLLGYFTTETGATKVLNYDPVPGEYKGCIPLDEAGGKVWAT